MKTIFFIVNFRNEKFEKLKYSEIQTNRLVIDLGSAPSIAPM